MDEEFKVYEEKPEKYLAKEEVEKTLKDFTKLMADNGYTFVVNFSIVNFSHLSFIKKSILNFINKTLAVSKIMKSFRLKESCF